METLNTSEAALSDALNGAQVQPQDDGLPQEAAPLPPGPAAAEEIPDRHDAAIAAWVAAYIHNSPIARNTDAFNHMMQTALPALRLALQETI